MTKNNPENKTMSCKWYDWCVDGAMVNAKHCEDAECEIKED